MAFVDSKAYSTETNLTRHFFNPISRLLNYYILFRYQNQIADAGHRIAVQNGRCHTTNSY